VQSFDLEGKSQGPATPLFQATDGPAFFVDDVSVAPTGEILLLHSHAIVGDGRQNFLYASFLSVGAPDGGPSGLTLVRTQMIESAPLGEPHAIWAVEGSSFVVSWKYATNAWYVRARRFLTDGRGAGGANVVNNPAGSNNDQGWDDGRIGTSGMFLGSSARNPANAIPYLTVLDKDGAQVGDFIQLSPLGVDHWVITGGMAGGFVNMFSQGGNANGVFVPIGSDGKPKSPAVDGGVDGGPPTFATFTFPTTASTAQAISDDTGGNGGVGVVMLERNGASFIYVKPDGVSRLSTGTVISSANGIETSISNYHGSFAVSLFDSVTHAAAVVASGCDK
jgi:hypothetical protein